MRGYLKIMLLFCNFVLVADLAESGIPHGNVHRTGYVESRLNTPLELAWEHLSPVEPRPAWREPAWEPQRIDFDYAYAVAACDQTVFYSSSSDHGLHALDLKTGEERWVFLTEGPVRLAPDFHEKNVLFSSDDGWCYCVDRNSGKLVWKYRPAGIPDSRLIGNEQMISRWPCRSGVLVEGDRCYTTFGMLATEGIAVCCLSAATGKEVWINDTSGHRYMARPHVAAMGGVAPHGYLAVNDKVLVVTCGRSTPALFDKQSGECIYHDGDGDFTGGACAMATDDYVFMQADTLKKEFGSRLRRDTDAPEAEIFDLATLVAINPQTGREVFSLRGGSRGSLSDNGGLTLIGRGELIHVTLDDVLSAIKEKTGYIEHTMGHFVENKPIRKWSAPVDRAYTLLQAGSTVIAGGRGWVRCYDDKSGRQLWNGDVRGQVRAMCLAENGLIVSTTEGRIYCFKSAGDASFPAQPPHLQGPSAADRQREPSASRGFCLAVGDYDAASLVKLAADFDLVISPVPGRKAKQLRQALYETGLNGNRVAVHRIDAEVLPYTDFFADEIHIRRANTVQAGESPYGPGILSECYRLLRPYGGRMVFEEKLTDTGRLQAALKTAGIPSGEIRQERDGLVVERGQLDGAGEWTHQYGDPGKRASSDEKRVKLPLKAAWFGGMGPANMVSRHFRQPAPLVIDGRCFVPGTDNLTAMNIYNGRILWERNMPELAHWPAAYRGPSLAVDHQAVYALQELDCLVLNPEDGDVVARHKVPLDLLERDPKGMIWEYLAVCDDLIIGTIGLPNQRRSWWSLAYPVNYLLFAMDKRSGKIRWHYTAEEGIDSNAIVIDDGRICIIDGQPRYGYIKPPVKVEPRGKRKLRALDLASGKVLWEQSSLNPTLNSLWTDKGVLIATQIPFSREMQDVKAAKAGGGITAYSVKDGSELWRLDEVKNLMPVIIGDVFYTPNAHELKTGKPVAPLSGGEKQFSADMPVTCSTYAGCESMIMARRSSLGFFDLSVQGGVFQYPVVRAGCWINMIPAGGLVTVPEGSSSCQCAYNFKTSIALMSDERQYNYGIGGSGTEDRPAVRINFGAPGDRPDRGGRIWLAWPRPVAYGRCLGNQPYGGRVVKSWLQVSEPKSDNKAVSFGRNPDWIAVEGTDEPWLFACGLRGPLHLKIRASDKIPAAKQYKVTLSFCMMPPDERLRRFDVKLDGKTVLEEFELSAGRQAQTRIFTIPADGEVELELVPRSGAEPVINAIEIEQAEDRQ